MHSRENRLRRRQKSLIFYPQLKVFAHRHRRHRATALGKTPLHRARTAANFYFRLLDGLERDLDDSKLSKFRPDVVSNGQVNCIAPCSTGGGLGPALRSFKTFSKV